MMQVLIFFIFCLPLSNAQGGGGLLAGLGDLGRQLGLDMRPPGHGNHRHGSMNQDLNGLLGQLFPPPQSDIPPHIWRRIVRFCSRKPHHPRCRGHPEWVRRNVPTNPMLNDLNDMFPELLNFKLPPIEKLNLPDVLRNVPQVLKNFVPPSIVGQITEITRNLIRSTCRSTGGCKKQSAETLNERATIAEQEAMIFKHFNKGKSQTEVDKLVETRLQRTQQVKKALLKNAGLANEIEPENNGVFQKDVLLTEEQSVRMINEIQAGPTTVPNGAPPIPPRFIRSALFLESTPTQRWPNDRPIQYMFDQTLNENDKNAVKAAIREIETKTCVRFRFETTKPSNSHIYYVKAAASSICGLSYIGRVDPVNPIYLTFACGNPTGVAVHETLHALGLNHEQLRGDRDQFIKINWENVNPQNYDFFAIADGKQFTSYGVKYDYGSIMHYNQFIASQYPNKPTMTAKINPSVNDKLMGQRNGLSQRDIEMVNKMYCVPGCDDKNIYCGAWALGGFCTTAGQKQWMSQNCKKSCNLC